MIPQELLGILPFIALASFPVFEGKYVGNDNVAMTVRIDLDEEGKWRNKLNLKRWTETLQFVGFIMQ